MPVLLCIVQRSHSFLSVSNVHIMQCFVHTTKHIRNPPQNIKHIIENTIALCLNVKRKKKYHRWTKTKSNCAQTHIERERDKSAFLIQMKHCIASFMQNWLSQIYLPLTNLLLFSDWNIFVTWKIVLMLYIHVSKLCIKNFPMHTK